LSLYVHIPWCVHKCPYCDFNSHEIAGPLPEQPYIRALLADLESQLPWAWGRSVGSVFFGGGTPSLLTGSGLAQLLSGLRQRLDLAADAEITLEANPGTVDCSRLADFREAGVNRLSLGIQSFNDQHLKMLERIHDREQALEAIARARESFDNFNLDLMHGLPGQDLSQALEDVEQALSHQPTHLSCYQLTLEPHTRFHHQPPSLPHEDVVAEMGEAIEARLDQAGWVHYEVSAFCRPGKAARHNLNYWGFGDYLGIGAGAHGKITTPSGRFRTWRPAHPQQYMSALESPAATLAPLFENPLPGLPQITPIGPADLPFEFAMNAFRLNQGFALQWFTQRTGLPAAAISAPLEQAQKQGWLVLEDGRARPTPLGRRFLNDLIGLFLP
jgi:oxygen-independent coproporphyrinogen-3 oxidase